MGIVFRRYLDLPTHCNLRVFGCLKCRTHLASSEDIISKVRDTLKESLTKRCLWGEMAKRTSLTRVNVIEGSVEDRCMTTGVHTVMDIYCTYCEKLVGWKYIKAQEAAQKYKEGMFILERQLLCEVSVPSSLVTSER